MIYVSTSCVRNRFIGESVRELAEEGYHNIELSGGTQPYEKLEEELLQLKQKYNLNFLCHNYFPPPEVPFVVNLASLDEEIFQMSMEHLKKAIDLSKKLGAKRFGFHAGFLINIPLDEIGKSIGRNELFPHPPALNKFFSGYKELKKHAGKDFNLYFENNVCSEVNYQNFGNQNPFHLCESESYKELSVKDDFGLILDVAHLKVSCRTLGLDFENELNYLSKMSDYIHISDNDGTKDSNQELKEEGSLFKSLQTLDFEDKIITLEVYDGLAALKSSYELCKSLF